ncbi:MAG: low molecular weight protein arginine phosphatase [Bacillota bacterium]
MAPDSVYRVLLVCSGNTCRSSMAEALMKQALQRLWPEGAQRVEVSSAGTAAWPGQPAADEAVAAMAERGLDLSQHRARRLDQTLAGQYALILTMTRSHKAQVLQTAGEGVRVYTLREYARPDLKPEQADIADPFGSSLDVYRQAADELAAELELAVLRLKSELEGPAAQPPGDKEDKTS